MKSLPSKILGKFKSIVLKPLPKKDLHSPSSSNCPVLEQLPIDFSESDYLTLNPDVKAAGVDPKEHYLLYGIQEGRQYRIIAQSVVKKSLTTVDRSNYKETWNLLSPTMDDAKMVVGGFVEEESYEITAQHTVKNLEDFVGINDSDTILEIGCGVGRVGKVLSPRCSKWIGTDISGQMLKFARQRLDGLSNIELIELQEVGLQEIHDESIDLVYCTVVFMHLFEWDRYKYVEEAFRILKPGGRCYFDNADIASEEGWKFFLQHYNMDARSRPAHISMVSSKDELRVYAERAGFEKVQTHQFDNLWVAVTGIKPTH